MSLVFITQRVDDCLQFYHVPSDGVCLYHMKVYLLTLYSFIIMPLSVEITQLKRLQRTIQYVMFSAFGNEAPIETITI